MDIGIPKERQPSEYRVGLSPSGVRLLTELGHTVYFERSAGEGAGFRDSEYRSAGGQVVYSGEEAYGRSELMLKFSRPARDEISWVRRGQLILGYLHLNAAPKDEVEALLERGVTALAYERILGPDGTNPVLTPLSQIGGRMAATLAAKLLQNDSGSRGVLLSGVPGVPPAEVVIIGAGVAGSNAAQSFLALGAQVTLLDVRLKVLQRLDCTLPGQPVTMLANPHTIATACSYADVVVGAVRTPGSRPPVVLERKTLRSMKRGALFIDLSIDEGGCAETSRPTTHQDPTYVEEGVVHCCIPNLPSAVARTSCHAFLTAGWPYLERIVEEGLAAVVADDSGVAKAVMIRGGEPVHYRPIRYGEPSGSGRT